MSMTIDCPKCEHEHADHADDATEMACEACGFTFLVTVEYHPSYSTFCVKHEWILIDEMPGMFRCIHCQRHVQMYSLPAVSVDVFTAKLGG